MSVLQHFVLYFVCVKGVMSRRAFIGDKGDEGVTEDGMTPGKRLPLLFDSLEVTCPSSEMLIFDDKNTQTSYYLQLQVNFHRELVTQISL